MSNLALNAVFERSTSTGIARLVLLAIADRADASGRAWCGSADIAARANIGRNNVPRALRSLGDSGELVLERRAGPKCCNVYRISDTLMAGQPHGEAASPRAAGSLAMSQKRPHGEAQTQGNPRKPGPVRFNPREAELPFPSDQFRRAWSEWCGHRAEIRKPLTALGAAKQLGILSAMGEQRAIAAIDHSIACGWTGLFEQKSGNSRQPGEERCDTVRHSSPPRIVTA